MANTSGSLKEDALQETIDKLFAEFDRKLMAAYPALRRHETLDEFSAKHRDKYIESVKSAVRTAMWRDA